LPESQADFRKSKSTLDNIFIPNPLVQRGGSMERRKDVRIFTNLRAVLNNIDKEILWRMRFLRGKGLEEGIIRRLEKIYERTEVTVRLNQKMSRVFQTRKGVKQGCALSSLLFNLYMAEIDEALRCRIIGGIEIGRDRNPAYADDIVLLTKNKEAIEDMMSILGEFLKNRRLELNAEKISVFDRKGNERKKK